MPPTLIVSPLVVELGVGETLQLSVTPTANGVKWTCNACQIATVNNTGLITALAEGSGTITARRGNQTVTVNVTVVAVEVPTPVPPLPPTVVLKVVAGITEADTWELDSAGTVAGEGDTIVSSRMDFGDGSAVIPYAGAPPETIEHVWTGDGTFQTVLSVMTAAGIPGRAVLGVVVPPGPTPPDPEPVWPPTAVLSYLSGQYVGQIVEFSTIGTSDPDGTIASYTIDYGDGTTETVAGPPPNTLTHTYATAGTFTAVLTVTDADDLVSTNDADVTVEAQPTVNQAPVAMLAKTVGLYAGEQFTFSTAGSHDPDGTLVSGRFERGDGTQQTWVGPPPATVSYTYPSAGSRTAQLIVTDNGGLSHTKTLAVSVLTAPTPGSGDRNAYYNQISVLPQVYIARSLRSQSELNTLYKGSEQAGGRQILYDSGTDTARFLLPANKVNLQTQDQLNIPFSVTSGDYIITWDAKIGPEWLYDNSNGDGPQNIEKYKHYQIRRQPGEDITDETRTEFGYGGVALPTVARVNGRYYGSGGAVGPNVTNNQPLSPQDNPFFIQANIWTRYWLRLQMGVGGYNLHSLWVSDETVDAVQIHDALQLGNFSPKVFQIECNTSSGPRVGPQMRMDFRNVVILTGYGDPTPLFEKPVA